MKKILIFLLLLLKLHITTDSGSLGIGVGEVAAQGLYNETLDEVTVTGRTPRCSKCGDVVTGGSWYMENHMKYICSYRTETCGYCWQNYIPYYGHLCPKRCSKCHKLLQECTCQSRCTFCNNPSGTCNCSVTVTGRGGGGGGGSGSSVTSSTTVGTVDTSNQKTDSKPIHSRITMEDLFRLEKLGQVKLVKNLPKEIPIQWKDHECTVMALAFMASLAGDNYSDIYNKATAEALKQGYDFEYVGLWIDDFIKIYNKVCHIKNPPMPFTFNYIEKQIAEHKSPVSVVKKQSDGTLHMVTIIGYDNEYYYVAAWMSTSANKIQKDKLRDYNVVYEIEK